MSFKNKAKYSNPAVPHEVNVSATSPLTEFVRLSLATIAGVVVLCFVVFFIARLAASHIPFSWEQVFNAEPEQAEAPAKDADLTCAQSLQNLADRLAATMKLPAGMSVVVHYVDADEPNAYATLGGNIFVNRGLLKMLHSENALAMVLAHEIAHVKHRDPIVSLGGGVAVALIFSALIGGSDGGALVGWAVGFTQMSFSRDQEERADAEALATLRSYYGFTNGADEFFNAISKDYPLTSKIPAFLSTHPALPERLQTIRDSFSEGQPQLTDVRCQGSGIRNQ